MTNNTLIAMVMLAVALSINTADTVRAEPVLMLNEPRDLTSAKYSCDWAANEIKQDQYLMKEFRCSEVELCQRALDINATCKVRGAAADVREFHSKLLTQFAITPQCQISITRLTDGKSGAEVTNDLEAFKRADWELNLAFTPGAAKQEWALWPMKSGNIQPGGPLQGEGDVRQIARDVCTILTRSGAKILN
jgi:hypothetical protein